MGIKRLLTVIIVVAIVLGSVIALFFQTGADVQVIKAVFPSLERRFGVKITYGEIDTSLTGLTLNKVEVRTVSGEGLFAVVERVGVNVRIGPLFFGELDVTGIRLDGLDLRAGRGLGGAGPKDWMQLARRFTQNKPGKPGEKNRGESNRPEIYIASGKIGFNNGPIAVTVNGIEGRIGADGRTVIEVDEYELKHGDNKLLSGHTAEIQYHTESRRIAVQVVEPVFELPAKVEDLLSVARDVHTSFNKFRGSSSEKDAAGVSDRGGSTGGLLAVASGGLSAIIVEASGSFFDPDEKKKRVFIEKVTANITSTKEMPLSMRANGGLPGTDARWTLGAKVPSSGNPRVILEIPDMSLATVGEMIIPVKNIHWDRAFADGSVTVEIERDSQNISISGQTALSGITINNPRLAGEPLKDLKLHGDYKVTYDREEGVLHLERFLLSMGLARATIRGDIWPDRLAFNLYLNVPPTGCKQLKEALPEVLTPRLKSVLLGGQLALDLHLAVDEQKPEDVVLEMSIDNKCRISTFGEIPEPNFFRGPFSYIAYDEEGKALRLITGAGTDRWTTLSAISPYIIGATLTTEDGKFWRHSGMTLPEIRRAIELNLKKDALRHGASTITMQLAKNLFLTRERTVERKIQEIFFVWYLEVNFSKEEILELYLNVVEFGPSIYGIRDAAEHYFGREPSELNALESVFLIKLLPSPVKRHRSYRRNEVSKRKMAGFHRVLRTMKERGHLTEKELAEALKQKITFHMDGDPLPTPRSPVRQAGSKRQSPIEERYSDSDTTESENPVWDEAL